MHCEVERSAVDRAVRGEARDKLALIGWNAGFVRGRNGICQFEEFPDLIRRRDCGAELLVALAQLTLLEEDCGLPLDINLARDHAVRIAVREAPEAFVEPSAFKLHASEFRIAGVLPMRLVSRELPAEVSPLGLREGEAPERIADLAIDRFLADGRRRTPAGVAAIVGVSLLRLSDQRVAAVSAAEQAAEEKVVLDDPCPDLARKNRLNL